MVTKPRCHDVFDFLEQRQVAAVRPNEPHQRGGEDLRGKQPPPHEQEVVAAKVRKGSGRDHCSGSVEHGHWFSTGRVDIP